MRIAAGLEYEGTAYSGWQAQGHARGVQTEVEAALSRIADQTVATTCAGRTDAGVHAAGQVIHFDTTAQRPTDAWLLGGNSQLPPDISLRWIRPVADEFHARYSARARRYRYVIHNSRSRSGLFAHRAGWCTWPLDAQRMHEAARHLLGEHDFSAYRAAECQSRTPHRRVLEISVKRSGEWLAIEIEANAFLHHMVRNIAGVLMAIGRGSQPVDWTRTVLEGRDRRLGGVTAGPEGLYFLQVRYDAHFQLPLSELPGFGVLP
ncbi:MAG: tRNA pseudouridine(38-40) synthase TruA [Nevskiales bacterium]